MKPSAYQSILDAAKRLIREIGAGNLTLDKVAIEAGVSKGGLLYHFPTKENLLAELIRCDQLKYAESYGRHLGSIQPKPGRAVRAYLMSSIESHDREDDDLNSSIMSAAANSPLLTQVYRDFYQKVKEDIRQDGGDFYDQWQIILTFDAMWMSELFDMYGNTGEDWQMVIQKLLERITNIEKGFSNG